MERIAEKWYYLIGKYIAKAGVLERISYELLICLAESGYYSGGVKMPLRARLQAARKAIRTHPGVCDTARTYLDACEPLVTSITRTRNFLAHAPMLYTRFKGRRGHFLVVNLEDSLFSDEVECMTQKDLNHALRELDAFMHGLRALAEHVEQAEQAAGRKRRSAAGPCETDAHE